MAQSHRARAKAPPGRQVVAVTGDGFFGFTAMEIAPLCATLPLHQALEAWDMAERGWLASLPENKVPRPPPFCGLSPR